MSVVEGAVRDSGAAAAAPRGADHQRGPAAPSVADEGELSRVGALVLRPIGAAVRAAIGQEEARR